MIPQSHVRSYYYRGFMESDIHKEWPWLWNKHYRIRSNEDVFIKLNSFRDRLDFRSLKKFCIHFAPCNVYMSVLNWLRPEKVGFKEDAKEAYPFGGEYVVDVDADRVYRRHRHHIGLDNVCLGCLEIARKATLEIMDKILENYCDVRVVFSGQHGYHIHVLDFDVWDWTYYDPGNPVKSHEVARYLYTLHLKKAVQTFDKYHFILSCDPMRTISFPGSLNGDTGLVCKHVGGLWDLEESDSQKIVKEARARRHFHDNQLVRASDLYTHPEPIQDDDDG